jgi:hypothetical protein
MYEVDENASNKCGEHLHFIGVVIGEKFQE